MTFNQKKWNLLSTCIILFLVSAFLSVLFIKIIPSTGNDINNAKNIGIISITTLSGYSKSKETSSYIISIFVTLSLSIIASFFLKKKISDVNFFNTFEIKRKKLTIVELLIAFLILLSTTYYSNFFYSNWFNHYTFFSEEGQHLSYVNNMFHGKNLYSDTYVIYGPLMEYPIYLMMKLFQKDIIVARYYTYFLDLFAFLIIYAFLRRLLNKSMTAIAGTVLFVAFYFPVFPAPNGSIMRVISGLLPILIISLYEEERKKYFVFFSGISAGAAFLFSQEIGLSSSIALMSIIAYIAFVNKTQIKDFIELTCIFASGIIILCLPFFTLLLYNGSLTDYLVQTVSYPYYVTLGLGNLPSPSFKEAISSFISNSGRNELFNLLTVSSFYWLFIIYLLFLTLIVLNYFTSPKRGGVALGGGTVVYGIIILRGALSRSGIDRNYLLLPPAIIISIYLIEKIFFSFFTENKKRGIAIIEIAFSLLLIGGIVSYGMIPARWCISTFAKSIYSKVAQGSMTIKSYDMQKLGVNGAQNLSIPEREAKRIKNVINYVKPKLKDGDSIFVFPNDATFYFLLDYPMPARFGVLHDAATASLKRQVLDDLKQSKPRFIINTEKIWQVDRIPEELEFSEIKSYIDLNFNTVFETDGIKVLEQKDNFNEYKHAT
ncbi:MAG: hypothetical protein HZA77_13555 [Candidatus Schekmanbacteria bacterium]|nr:hypothetical protein [Candidatus Schekmanbacteria bacterium]